MADYFTQFSCTLNLHTNSNVNRALEIYSSETEDRSFSVEVISDTEVWIYAEDFGDPEHVTEYVKILSAEFKLEGKWGFNFAYTCSKPHIDAFGGGACVIDLSTGDAHYLYTSQWLMENTSCP